MYASYRTVSKAQGWDDRRREQSAINRLRHRKMQKTHTQVTPDGKVIQHYRTDTREIVGKRLLQEALQKMAKEAEEKKAAEEVQEKQEEETK